MYAGTEVGRLLHEDHRATIAKLTRVEAFLTQTDDDRTASVNAPRVRELIGDLHRLVKSETEPRFDFEERVLFPILNQRGAHGLTVLLEAEHAGIRPLARCLQRLCATALRDGFSEENWAAFRGLAGAFAAQMLSHIEHEETALLEAVDAALDPALAPGLDRWLAEAFRAAIPNASRRSKIAAHRTGSLTGQSRRPESTQANPSLAPETEATAGR